MSWVARVVGAALDQVGDQAGDVVGAAGLEAGADQLDGGVVGGAAGRGCRPAGRRRGRRWFRRCTAAAGRRRASSRTNRSGSRSWVPSIALRMRLRCGCTRASASVIRPSSIRRLDERVVVGELADLAVAEEVGAAVADVAHADPLPVEERDGGGGAGAVEGGVLVDELGDPVVRAVQRVADQTEQVAVAGVRARRSLLELAQLRDRRTRRDVAAGRAAHAVTDGDDVRADVPGVLVVLADATHIEIAEKSSRTSGHHRGTPASRTPGTHLAALPSLGWHSASRALRCTHLGPPPRTSADAISARGSSCRCAPGCRA